MRPIFLVLLLGAFTAPTAALCAQDCPKPRTLAPDGVPKQPCDDNPWSMQPDSPFSPELQDKFRRQFERPNESNVSPVRPSEKLDRPGLRLPNSR